MNGLAGKACISQTSDGEFTYGLNSLQNTTAEPVRLVRADLVRPTRAEVVGQYVVPLVGRNRIGLQNDWPPPGTDPATVERGALPTELPPASELNLVLRVRASAGAGFERVRVVYELGGQEMSVESQIRLTVRTACLTNPPQSPSMSSPA